jgi:hypothetical protein
MIVVLKARHVAIGRCRQTKKQTQDDGVSLQKLAAARGRLTLLAIPAPHKGHSHQGPGKDDAVRGTPKGRTFDKRRRV